MNPVITDTRRLTALRRTGLLDAPPSVTFDRLPTLATRLLGVLVAPVSLVEADRQCFVPEEASVKHGAGLGLAISRAIAGRPDGSIWAESNDGPGSIFHVAIPDRA